MAEISVERQEQPSVYDQYLGQGDLKLHPLWKNEWLTVAHDEDNPFLQGHVDQKIFERILVELGADLPLGYASSVCMHRNRTSNAVTYGLRVTFKERTDKWWVDNMMSTSDLVRHVSEREGSIRAVGMRESLMEESPMHSAMMAAAERLIVTVDIKVKDDSDVAALIEETK
jgi:hypothetical protein